MKAAIEKSNTSEFILSHLQPDTVYDLKLQSFNSKFASNFSSIVKVKTKGNTNYTESVSLLYFFNVLAKHKQVHSGTTQPPLVTTTGTEKAGLSLYVIVAGAIIGCALLICSIALIFVCRKWKQKKSGTIFSIDLSKCYYN